MNQKLRAVFFILSSAFTLQLASSVAAQTVLPCNIVLNGIEYPNGSVLYVNAGDPMNFGGVYGAPSHHSGGPGGNIAPALDALSAESDPQATPINVDPATDPIRYFGGGTGTEVGLDPGRKIGGKPARRQGGFRGAASQPCGLAASPPCSLAA